MKTIIPGKIEPKQVPWWVGKKVVCSCGFVGEIEEGDEKIPGFHALAERCINGKRSITMHCPTGQGTAKWDSVKASEAGNIFNR